MTIPGKERKTNLQRGIIILPSAFTLGNLFFGVYALVAASRGDLIWAAGFIVFAAILDTLDGRIARFTRTGSRFGAELDSLVDAISFGVAPGFIMYQLYFSDGTWSWMLVFVYIAAVVARLARFNIEQDGEAKHYFYGLPCPTPGMILATYYPFSQTPFFETYLTGLPWPQIMAVTMVLLSILMLSHIPYPVFPRIGLRTRKGLFNTVFIAGCVFAAITVPRYWFFPLLTTYTAWGLIRSALLGLLDRIPERDPLIDEDDEEGEDRSEVRSVDYGELAPRRKRKRRRPRRKKKDESSDSS